MFMQFQKILNSKLFYLALICAVTIYYFEIMYEYIEDEILYLFFLIKVINKILINRDKLDMIIKCNKSYFSSFWYCYS
jgi:hypothetical protein